MYTTPFCKEVIVIQLSERQCEIVDIVQRLAPVTGEKIAEELGLTRPTLRSDLALLVMLGLVDAKPKVGYLPGRCPKYDSQIGTMLKKLTVADVLSDPILISGDATRTNDDARSTGLSAGGYIQAGSSSGQLPSGHGRAVQGNIPDSSQWIGGPGNQNGHYDRHFELDGRKDGKELRRDPTCTGWPC
jgi:DNA-binding transcriptional ArsR family regulator